MRRAVQLAVKHRNLKRAQCVIVSVRPDARRRQRRGSCRRPADRYDHGRGRRRWRDLDHGVIRVFLEAEAPRVACREHGVTAAAVPWARHGAGHTHAFDQQTAWMAAEGSNTATAQLMRTSWGTVGNIVERFVADRDRHTDRLNGLRRIGIDEISHRKGQKYMTVVVCHDSGKVVWKADGHGKSVLHALFDALGAERAGRLTHISADGALWIAEVLTERAPASLRVMDPFHVVAWATEALDTERRASWNRARRELGDAERARALKDSRFGLWKNKADLTDRQAAKLTWIAATDPRLHRAWRLKEALRAVFTLAKTRHGVLLELSRVPLACIALLAHYLDCFLRDLYVPVSGCRDQRWNFTISVHRQDGHTNIAAALREAARDWNRPRLPSDSPDEPGQKAIMQRTLTSH